jgi:hypothetical protein
MEVAAWEDRPLILSAAASVLFGIIYFFILGGRSPAPANIFRALILLVPSSDWLKFKNPEAPQLGGRRRRTGGNNA